MPPAEFTYTYVRQDDKIGSFIDLPEVNYTCVLLLRRLASSLKHQHMHGRGTLGLILETSTWAFQHVDVDISCMHAPCKLIRVCLQVRTTPHADPGVSSCFVDWSRRGWHVREWRPKAPWRVLILSVSQLEKQSFIVEQKEYILIFNVIWWDEGSTF